MGLKRFDAWRNTLREFDDEVLAGMLCFVGGVGLPVGLVRYVHPESFPAFAGLVVGGICGGAGLGLLLFYALPYAIGMVVLWIVYCFYAASWPLALFGVIPLLVSGALLRWKQLGRDARRRVEANKVLNSSAPGGLREEESPERTWDVFISHASEDKATVARPLALHLQARGVAVWLDEGELHLGDSLRQKIEHGLAHSRYGVVILSQRFFEKDWPLRELEGLMSRESTSCKVILPVWHNLDHQLVSRYSPLLAGKLAANTRRGMDAVANEIMAVIETRGRSLSH